MVYKLALFMQQGDTSSRIFFLSLMIFIPTWAAGRDCDSSDGYIRNNLDNVTDNCDYECGWMQCGDVCIHSFRGYLCFCGEIKKGRTDRMDLFRGTHYCCVDQSPAENRTQCSVDSYGHGYCPQGRIVSQDDTCNGHCFNDYETSAVIGWRPRFRCGDHHCVVAKYMCLGYPLCPDSRDVSKCDEDLKCRLGPGTNYNRSVLVSDLSGGHYYCSYEITINDGEYDTITRKDETDLDIISSKVLLDYTTLTECNCNTAGSNLKKPGLMCGEQCVENKIWCREQHTISCGNFSTDNKQLCANTTFWAGKSCDKVHTDDTVPLVHIKPFLV